MVILGHLARDYSFGVLFAFALVAGEYSNGHVSYATTDSLALHDCDLEFSCLISDAKLWLPQHQYYMII